MSNSTMSIIDAPTLETTRMKVRASIEKKRRAVEGLRAIAKHFDGTYCTRRILPQLTALFPTATHSYMGDPDYVGNINLTISYGYMDSDEFTLCKADNRRIDGAELNARAEKLAVSAGTAEDHLQHITETVSAYNAVAADYAEIYEDMREWFSDIPYADYQLCTQARDRRKENEALTLRMFARKYA